MRLAGFGLRRPKAPNPGRSLAGTVESAGQKVTGFKPGDEVYGVCSTAKTDLLRAHLLFSLVSQKLSTFIASENSADLRVLRDLIESGTITPAIDRTYPLSQTPAAIRHVQDGRARGKVVITI